MFEEDDRETGYALFLVIALAVVVSLFTIGIAAGTAIDQAGSKNPSVTRALTPTMLSGAPAPAAAMPGSLDPSAARLYFELGKAELPPDALTRLAPLIHSAGDGTKSLRVAGFHDASGDAAANAELAKQRALAVRDLLVAAGVSAERIDLRKPALTVGDGDAKAARRVEVTAH